MRYIVFGAGAVGGVIGGRLHAAGHDVILLARGPHLDAVLRRVGENEQAIESYQRALEIDDTYAWAWNGQGLAFAALQRWDEALACYELAVHYHEHDSWFWHNYGEALLNIGDYQEAIAAFERALEINPEHQHSQNKLAEARQRLEEEE